ncbi:MAG: RNA polymerase sigma factor [Planctomycetota bacterium]
MPQVPTDRVLVRRCLAGDLSSFEALVRRHQLAVWTVVTAMLWNRSLIEDLVQETFLQAFASLERYEPEQSFSPWIKQIARNQVREHLRRNQREHEHRERLQDLFLRLEEERSAEAGADEEWLAALQECRQELPARSRSMLDDYYRRGLSCSEIARLMRCTPAAVQKALSRVRQALRLCIHQRVGR